LNDVTIGQWSEYVGDVSTTDDLARDRALLERTSTAERVAGILRDRIMEGQFLPGSRLSEDTITAGLGISRNTLREAFRLLAHERLLVHELNRGVFVRVLDTSDVVDLYRVRRVIECAALRGVHALTDADAKRLTEAVADADAAAEAGRWQDVGTANLRFHQAIAALHGSPRVDELMRQLSAELRLVFHAMDNARMLYEPYLPRNRAILEHLLAGDNAGAEQLLDAYLADAEDQLAKASAR
jgi:DNA-binding GntR family transcriptional regulator